MLFQNEIVLIKLAASKGNYFQKKNNVEIYLFQLALRCLFSLNPIFVCFFWQMKSAFFWSVEILLSLI